MKFKHSFLFFLVFSIPFFSSAAAVEILPEYKEVFLPGGFDSTDNSQMIVFGEYKNSCYSQGNVDVNVDHKDKIVHVWMTQLFAQDTKCIQWVKPFTKVVDLGILKKGDYEIFLNTENEGRNLPVSMANNSGPDERPYAPVSQVTYDQHNNELTVKGILLDSCAKFERLETIYEKNRKVVAVLPILDPRENCSPEASFNVWEAKTKLDLDQLNRLTLVHVRSMNGESKNLVIQPILEK